jgi:hypothetical protein
MSALTALTLRTLCPQASKHSLSTLMGCVCHLTPYQPDRAPIRIPTDAAKPKLLPKAHHCCASPLTHTWPPPGCAPPDDVAALAAPPAAGAVSASRSLSMEEVVLLRRMPPFVAESPARTACTQEHPLRCWLFIQCMHACIVAQRPSQMVNLCTTGVHVVTQAGMYSTADANTEACVDRCM